LHLIKEIPATSSIKEGAAGAVKSNHHEKQAIGKEGEADHRRYKHSPWERRNGGMPVGYS
jgi:hypothetical protein